MAQDVVTVQLVVIGGSAGSLEVVMNMVPHLPIDAGVIYVIVLHRKADGESVLADIIGRRTAMPVREAEDKEPLLPDTIYIAPADYHLLFESKKTCSLDSSEKVHHSRPSIDVTFESAAAVFGASALGVLLSGANADGAAGLLRIRQAGGMTLVQDPATAEVSYMPEQAVETGGAIEVVPADRLGETLKACIQQRKLSNA
jgi:two-component system, chemotaxis family, protein-glutamate methylesterase/glutaminase